MRSGDDINPLLKGPEMFKNVPEWVEMALISYSDV